MIELVQAEFGEGQLAEEKMWQVLVLIPKGKGTTMALESWR